jgi:hypothetical protein
MALLASLILAGCGGGGGSSNPPAANPPPVPPPTGGIDRGGIAVGPIDGFGSVIVNGVRFETSDATFIVNGAAGTQADLDVGEVVVVVGTFDDDGLNGVAERVEFDDAVKGPVEAGSIDTATGLFRVLGQTVQVTNSTLFDDSIQPPSILGLSDDPQQPSLVEVSGLPDASGRIVATRIEAEPAGGNFEITGIVSLLDTGALTFQLNDQVVDYSAAQLDDFPGGQISEGDFVEAEGGLGPNGELLASQVEYRGDVVGDDDLEVGDEVEIEGIITVFRSSSDFDIAGVRVLTDGSTVYEGGTAADLGPNVRIEAEGEYDGNATFTADEIEFKPDGDLRISGIVEAVNAGTGTLQVLGITISTEPGTSFEDDLLDQQNFGLDDLRPNVDYVEIRGFEDSGNFVASQIERDEVDEDSVRGPGADVSAPTLTVIGVPVLTDGNTEFEDNDVDIDAGDFFAAAEGRLVDVKGTWDGTQLLAEEAELEDGLDDD